MDLIKIHNLTSGGENKNCIYYEIIIIIDYVNYILIIINFIVAGGKTYKDSIIGSPFDKGILFLTALDNRRNVVEKEII